MVKSVVSFCKHPLVHRAAKGDAKAKKQLKTLEETCIKLMNNSAKILDICAEVDHLIEKVDGEEDATAAWPTIDKFKTFQSVPRGWLWQFARNKDQRFTPIWIKKAEGKSHNIIREIFAYACNLDPNQPLPAEAHDQLVFSRVLNTRHRLV